MTSHTSIESKHGSGYSPMQGFQRGTVFKAPEEQEGPSIYEQRFRSVIRGKQRRKEVSGHGSLPMVAFHEHF